MSDMYLGTGEQSDIVISTVITVSRNLEDVPFPCKLNSREKTRVCELIKKEVCDIDNFKYIDPKLLTKSQLISFAEKCFCTPEFVSDTDGRGLLIDEKTKTFVMINETEHICMRVIENGLSLKKTYERIDLLDERLNGKLNFAFDEQLGYLTASPSILGTAMNACLILHLPALSVRGRLNSITNTVQKLGLSLRPAYSQLRSENGDIYMLSNGITLGISEYSAIENLEATALQIITQERELRKQLVKQIETVDMIYRALGILKNSRILPFKEFLELASHLRLGAVSEILNMDKTVIDRLIFDMQPAAINAGSERLLSERERDIARADAVRVAIK